MAAATSTSNVFAKALECLSRALTPDEADLVRQLKLMLASYFQKASLPPAELTPEEAGGAGWLWAVFSRAWADHLEPVLDVTEEVIGAAALLRSAAVQGTLEDGGPPLRDTVELVTQAFDKAAQQLRESPLLNEDTKK
eukprot:CAMPEP_0118867594 /NCGR_PEP_ID=MMETSP1163-20130328/11153_1 /TAXON_ID=124430 /ORGANISM="Phaeomonas parva, Strain CCMP2877" /LENGTH=137 /DNA_ID=CAMNT_0006802027 /DNA_START=9 /DNA_END=419 /DNA_ORIENTATION=-